MNIKQIDNQFLLRNPFSVTTTIGLVKTITNIDANKQIAYQIIADMISNQTSKHNQVEFAKLKAENYDLVMDVKYQQGQEFSSLIWSINYVPSLIDVNSLLPLIDEYINQLSIDEKTFSLAKANRLRELTNLFDNPQSYVKTLVRPSLFTNSLTPKEQIEVINNLEFDEIKALITDLAAKPFTWRYDCLNNNEQPLVLDNINYNPQVVKRYQKLDEIKDIELDLGNNQANLIMNFELNQEVDFTSLQTFNTVFGSGADSLLFKIVREAHHLCYSVNCQIIDQKYLSVYVGCDLDKVALAQDLIINILKDLANGTIDYDLASSKQQLIDTILQLTNDFNYQLRQVTSFVLFNQDYDQELRIKKIKATSEADIKNIAKNITLLNKILIK